MLVYVIKDQLGNEVEVHFDYGHACQRWDQLMDQGDEPYDLVVED